MIVNKKSKFLFFCMIFVGAFTYGQVYTMQSFSKSPSKSFIYKAIVTENPLPTIPGKQHFNFTPTSYSLIPPSLYTKNFGFFCKKELQLEKVTKLPLRFRLGSVQQCDWLEGKTNSGVR